MFLAAGDKDTPPIGGYDFNGRLEHFIHELALINRAHNWRKGPKRNQDGSVQYDAQGHPVLVEYDDGTPDRPSCYSGMKRRLFHSLVAHPLMMILSKDIMQQEIHNMLTTHFRALAELSEQDKKALLNAYTNFIELSADRHDSLHLLQQYDIATVQKEFFIAEMIDKYKPAFAQLKPNEFVNQIESALQNDITSAHILKFAGLLPITKWLAVETLSEQSLEIESRDIRSSQMLFSPKRSRQDDSFDSDEPSLTRPRI